MMNSMGPEEILAILPHRYPFLLVDRILEMGETTVVGIKNVTFNEPYFAGHFPGRPVMPGVIIVEAMAQVGGCLILSRHAAEARGRVPYLAGIDRCRFRRPVLPGDVLRIEVEIVATRGYIGKMHAVAHVGEDVAAEAEISFALVEAPPSPTATAAERG